jgi:Tfp pilus assembly protein PilO
MPRSIAILIIFAVSLLVGIFLLRPQYQSFNKFLEEAQSKRAELATKTEYYAQINDINVELEPYQDQLAKISSALPREQSLPSLLNYLGESASQTGLVLGDFAAADNKASRIKKINISLELSGSYGSLKDFIKAIEKSARSFEITNVSISAPQKKGDSFLFKLDIAANSY